MKRWRLIINVAAVVVFVLLALSTWIGGVELSPVTGGLLFFTLAVHNFVLVLDAL